MQSFIIREMEAGQRLDKYLKKRLSQAPGSFLYKMLRKKNITLNETKADGSEKLAPGDEIRMFLSEDTYRKFSGAEQLEDLSVKYPVTSLSVLYETEDVLMINKPAGMLSQKARPEDVSANESIIGYLLSSGGLTAADLQSFRPSVCNRLDRNTSGLLIAGKTMPGLQDMSNQLKNRTMEKYYQCLVKGRITEERMIRGWLTKDAAQNRVTISKEQRPSSDYIETAYHPLEICGGYTRLEVHLLTGRSHQIRAHLSSIGHPILGDPKYGNAGVNRLFSKECGVSRQLLHAWRIVLVDGTQITAPPAPDMERAWNHIRRKEPQ